MECKEHNTDRYKTFRTTYPEFIYEGFQVQETDKELAVTYHFRIPGLSEFTPAWKFAKPAGSKAQGKEGNSKPKAGQGEETNGKGLSDLSDNRLLRDMIFSLGMVELISYWKIACPPRVVVKAGALSQEQVGWWKNLYFNGLGEFFYVNQIQGVTLENFMDIAAYAPEDRGQGNGQSSKEPQRGILAVKQHGNGILLFQPVFRKRGNP